MSAKTVFPEVEELMFGSSMRRFLDVRSSNAFVNFPQQVDEIKTRKEVCMEMKEGS